MSQGGSNGGGFSQGSLGGSNDGFIFVWDLDKTLIGDDETINENAVRLIGDALESGRLTANLMLTNNIYPGFISAKQIAIYQKYISLFGSSPKNLFNLTYNGITPTRVDHPVDAEKEELGGKAKRIKDVENMLNELGLPTDSLESRVFFFDDKPNHVIRDEIRDHYIQITPPFQRVVDDTTDYARVYAALGIERSVRSRRSSHASKKRKRRQRKSRKTKRK